MNWDRKIEEIIKNNRWVKNDTGLWKVQCSKLFKDKEHLMLLLVTDELNGPAYARVQKIVVTNNDDLILFYDDKYDCILNENEYEKFKNIVSREEWAALFTGRASEKLVDMNIIAEEKGFYVEPHEGITAFMDNYDQRVSDRLAEQFNL